MAVVFEYQYIALFWLPLKKWWLHGRNIVNQRSPISWEFWPNLARYRYWCVLHFLMSIQLIFNVYEGAQNKASYHFHQIYHSPETPFLSLGYHSFSGVSVWPRSQQITMSIQSVNVQSEILSINTGTTLNINIGYQYRIPKWISQNSSMSMLNMFAS